MTDQIQSTANYDRFSYLEGNRTLIPGHLAKLTSSILTKNMLAQNPIVVNEKMQVIDGQHRLEVAKSNQLPIYYTVLGGATIEEVISLNANNRSWNGIDFLNSYASRGYRDYVWLKDFVDEYKLSLTQALAFIYGSDTSWTHEAVRNGKFEVSEKQKSLAKSRADVLWDLRPFIKRSGFIPRGFLLEVIHLHDEGLAKKLGETVKKKGQVFIPESARKDAYMQLRGLLA